MGKSLSKYCPLKLVWDLQITYVFGTNGILRACLGYFMLYIVYEFNLKQTIGNNLQTRFNFKCKNNFKWGPLSLNWSSQSISCFLITNSTAVSTDQSQLYLSHAGFIFLEGKAVFRWPIRWGLPQVDPRCRFFCFHVGRTKIPNS